ncbi:hypothetical protein [Methylacidimicrobium cyclopophantes]|uniref:hypothetical protein n=1 Tax=Methylacidimicrobium cyclopophantes TaxID=1041766 RepID=UPI00115C09EF|nr:hypothetical protein [Methylacidimicrobium cyclopophantes]
MGVPIHSADDILAALRDHPEWRRDLLKALLADPLEVEEIRKKLLSRELLALPETFAAAEEARKADSKAVWEAIGRLTERFEAAEEARKADSKAVWEAIGRLTERFEAAEEARKADSKAVWEAIGRLTERFEAAEEARREDRRAVWEAIEKLTEKVGRLEEAQERTSATLRAFMDATEKRLHGIELELDFFAGKSMEIDARKKLGNYLRTKVRKIRRCEEDVVDSLIDTALESGLLSEEEGDELGEADALIAGKDRETGELTCVAVEVSKTVDKHDVERALRRSKIFLKASRAAISRNAPEFLQVFPRPPEKAYALVVGRRITEGARQEAKRKGVLFAKYTNGHDREGG